jgi:restriction system protein
MGAIWFRRAELLGSLSEVVGYKSGLVLGRDEIAEHLPDEEEVWSGEDDATLRVRSEEYEEYVTELLYRVGNIESRRVLPPGIAIFHKYKSDPRKRQLSQEVMELIVATISAREDRSGPVDVTPALDAVFEKFGPEGAIIGLEFVESLEASIHVSPWGSFRRVEWVDQTELKALFESESLDTEYGSFLDQRFIDYLHRNFDATDAMNWRKFEALAAEYFTREGMHVEIGPGRDDGNVDLRVWSDDVSAPPTLLVQCKREKKKVGKVVVKALYADILEEKATSGLIVTTTALSPGAEKVCSARSYPIRQANRQTIRKWIEGMRTPMLGVFMGQ